MSTEIEITALLERYPELACGPLEEAFDRVLHTADDRPDEGSLPALVDPAADHLTTPAPDGRRADVDEKHRQVIAYLNQNQLEAVILGRADSIAWFTSGGDFHRDLASERAAASLFINRRSRAVVCDNVQSPRFFEEEVAGLGFQLKERPWHQDCLRPLEELAHGRQVATDLTGTPWIDASEDLKELRLRLTRCERQEIRILGRTLALAVEATSRNFTPGECEADVAGHLAHRLLREGVQPVDLRVASEERLDHFRQPTFKAAPIHRYATISVVGRRHGLHAACSRTISFGPAPRELVAAHQLAAMVDATCIYFSRPGEAVADVFRRARRIYEKFGHPDEWVLNYQGGMTGYSPIERPFRPDSPLVLGEQQALRWGPSVGVARSEDTVVVDERGYEVVTQAQDWPRIDITVKGFSMNRPGILERPVSG